MAARRAALAALLLGTARAVWEQGELSKRLVLDVNFETSKDYELTSSYAVRGWNTTEGHMKIAVPSKAAAHAGAAGMQITIDREFDHNFHAQFSLPHFMPRSEHAAYQVTFWAKVVSPSPVTPEVAFLDVDEGYDWVGGGQMVLSEEWQQIAMTPVPTYPKHKGHEIQIAFLIGKTIATFFFDDIRLYEIEVPSPPPPSPPPPPNFLLWIDGEGGPKGVQMIVKEGLAADGSEGSMTGDLSSTNAAHQGKYGFEATVHTSFEEDFYGFLTLPAFLVTDHERVYSLTFWAKATGNPKPRPHITFQDEDNNYAWINGEYVQLSPFWHQYTVNLVVPIKLRGHNVVTNLMLGSFEGTYYFDDFQVSDKNFVSPPPSPPSPPPSPPPTVLLQLSLESYAKGSINPQQWPEGAMEVVVQSQAAAYQGHNGLLIKVTKSFDFDWHAQVSLKPFVPPDVGHGYTFTFRGRCSSPDGSPMRPKVVFQDADDEYVPIKQVTLPLESQWAMYEVDLTVPKYRRRHAIVINFWVGDSVGTYFFDDLQVNIVAPFHPPPPPPPVRKMASPPPPGVVAVLGFEGTDDGLQAQRNANNGTWMVSLPDSKAAHTGAFGVYIEITTPWGVAGLAQLLLPRYVPRGGRETLLHLSFWARAEKMHAKDPNPCATVSFVDMQNNVEQLGSEEVVFASSEWQLYYVVVDLKTKHMGHSIRPSLDLGKAGGLYYFDDFVYQEIEIEDGMKWLNRHAERIKQMRMSKFKVSFRDQDLWPISDGTVSVMLEQHDFPLGVSLRTQHANEEESKWYRETAGQHFWAGTIEEEMRWDNYEPTPGVVDAGKEAVEYLVRWALGQGWRNVSAALFDGGHAGKDHWSNKLTCHDLEEQLRLRVLRDLHQFKGQISRYEVWRDAMRWKEWTSRCGQSLYYNAFNWARLADGAAILSTNEANILTTLTLTNAEAYHNSVWEMARNLGVPVGGIGVQAHFEGEVDASTVKHRLDVLREVGVPVYITELSISGLHNDPGQQAFELEKFLRIAFSHDAVAGVTLGDLWDKGNRRPGSGLYGSDKQPKAAVAKLDKLWREEWTTAVNDRMHKGGSLTFDGFYGRYRYQLIAGNQVCDGVIELSKDTGRKSASTFEEAREYVIQCDFKGQLHIPVWATPVFIACVMIVCLLRCSINRRELVNTRDLDLEWVQQRDKAPLRQGRDRPKKSVQKTISARQALTHATHAESTCLVR